MTSVWTTPWTHPEMWSRLLSSVKHQRWAEMKNIINYVKWWSRIISKPSRHWSALKVNFLELTVVENSIDINLFWQNSKDEFSCDRWSNPSGENPWKRAWTSTAGRTSTTSWTSTTAWTSTAGRQENRIESGTRTLKTRKWENSKTS